LNLLALMGWLAGLDSNYAALLSASILRNQLVNRFQLANIWSNNSKLLIIKV
jgi:hypothetical protein